VLFEVVFCVGWIEVRRCNSVRALLLFLD